jgi:hypothetical protein
MGVMMFAIKLVLDHCSDLLGKQDKAENVLRFSRAASAASECAAHRAGPNGVANVQVEGRGVSHPDVPKNVPDGKEVRDMLDEGQEQKGQKVAEAEAAVSHSQTERGREGWNLDSEALEALIQRAVSAKSSKERQQRDQLLTALQSVTDALWAIESRVSSLERQNERILQHGSSAFSTAKPGSHASPPRRRRASASPELPHRRFSGTQQREARGHYRSLPATAPVQVFRPALQLLRR